PGAQQQAALRGSPAAPGVRHHGRGTRGERRGDPRQAGCPRARAAGGRQPHRRRRHPDPPRLGQVIRGPKVIVPADAKAAKVTPEALEGWVLDGWVDLRLSNCERWVERFRGIHAEMEAMPESDTSSRFLRNRRFWHEERPIQPGKVVGWILGTQEAGARIKR